nr:MAG TPA: hypothetical protein [Caudoviricetes sp.]
MNQGEIPGLFYCKNKPKKFKETFDNKPKKSLL